MYEVEIVAGFSAAHLLRNYKGKCEHLHGHNYRVHVIARSASIGPDGMVIDFSELKQATNKVVERLDHSFLNDVAPFDKIEPSAENIASHLFGEIYAELKAQAAILHSVSVWESDSSRATFLKEP